MNPYGSGDRVSGKKVLIIEENSREREVLASICFDCGADTVIGCNCSDALIQTIKGKPDLIIFHPGVESRSGFYACKMLKSLINTKNIPILLTTSESLSSLGLFYNTYNFDMLIETPSSTDELSRKLKKIFSGN